MAIYFHSFRIEYIPQEVLNKIKDKSNSYNIFRIQSDDPILCRLFCKIIYKYFKDKYGRRKRRC